jgi:3-hydroxy-9,10-secoandrosta-1,3,5(10)-triene-9,17-dione monooxygenase reductase component
MAELDPRQFRAALGAFPTGVTIATIRDASGRDVGLTANSFNSVSLDPPLVLWSLSRKSSSMHAFEAADYFAVHILSAQQEDLASRFAQRDVDRFAGLTLGRGHGDAPLLDGCAARFECRRAHLYQGGDHVIIVGEVLTFEHFDRPALAFHGGKYALSLQKAADPKAVRPDVDSGELVVDLNGLNMLLAIAYRHLRLSLDPLLAAQGLSETDYWLLNMIGSEEGRTLARLNHLLRFTGQAIPYEQCAALEARGLIAIGDGGQNAVAHLTQRGRQVLIELSAATKSVEAAAESGLDFAEAQLMRQLLRRLIFSMRPGEDT